MIVKRRADRDRNNFKATALEFMKKYSLAGAFLLLFFFMRTAMVPQGNVYDDDTIETKSNLRAKSSKYERDGFMVLGMHRSGTSMLAGSLYTAAGYAYGEEIRKVKTNPKGTFELLPVLTQNDLWMEHQGIKWDGDILAYDWEQALNDKVSGTVPFEEGQKGLDILENTPANVPWLQKDPRMCVALMTWRKLLNKEPAILFTHRNPLEVAQSLEYRRNLNLKRKKNIGILQPLPVTKGLKLWIAYNQMAIQNSKGLCMVRTTEPSIMASPLTELTRISDELTNKCGVAPPPKRITQADIDTFIDPSLLHHRNGSKQEGNREVLQSFNGGSCLAHAFDSNEEKGTPEFEAERQTYLMAMKVYCDLESGVAFEDNYEWPKYSIEN